MFHLQGAVTDTYTYTGSFFLPLHRTRQFHDAESLHTSRQLLQAAVLRAAIEEMQNMVRDTRVFAAETCISPVFTQMAALYWKMRHMKLKV